jgi:hypothetical protein
MTWYQKSGTIDFKQIPERSALAVEQWRAPQGHA